MTSRTKQYDRNRFKKVYPRFRAEPRPGLRSDKDLVIEAIIVNFDNQESKQVTLDGPYTQLPGVSLTPVGDINNVNLFITSLSLFSVPNGSGRKALVTIEASTKFTGQIYLQALQA